MRAETNSKSGAVLGIAARLADLGAREYGRRRGSRSFLHPPVPYSDKGVSQTLVEPSDSED